MKRLPGRRRTSTVGWKAMEAGRDKDKLFLKSTLITLGKNRKKLSGSFLIPNSARLNIKSNSVNFEESLLIHFRSRKYS